MKGLSIVFLFFLLTLSQLASGVSFYNQIIYEESNGDILIENGTYHYDTFMINWDQNLTIMNATVFINKIIPSEGHINTLWVFNSTLVVNVTCDLIDSFLIHNSSVIINQTTGYELDIENMNVFNSSLKSESSLHLSINKEVIIKKSLLENIKVKYWPCSSHNSTLVIQNSIIEYTPIDYQPCEFLNFSLIVQNSIFTNSRISYNGVDYIIIKNDRFINTTLFGGVSLRGKNNVYLKFINNTLISDYRRSCFLSRYLFFGDDEQTVNKIISYRWLHLFIQNNSFLFRKGNVGFFIEVFPIIRNISSEEIMKHSWELSKFADYNVSYNNGYPPLKVAIYYFCLIDIVDKNSSKHLSEEAHIDIEPSYNRSIPNVTIMDSEYQGDLLGYYELNDSLEKTSMYKITVRVNGYYTKTVYVNATSCFYIKIYTFNDRPLFFTIAIIFVMISIFIVVGAFVWKRKTREK